MTRVYQGSEMVMIHEEDFLRLVDLACAHISRADRDALIQANDPAFSVLLDAQRVAHAIRNREYDGSHE